MPSQETINKVRELAEQGLTKSQMATKLGLKYNEISYICDYNKIQAVKAPTGRPPSQNKNNAGTENDTRRQKTEPLTPSHLTVEKYINLRKGGADPDKIRQFYGFRSMEGFIVWMKRWGMFEEAEKLAGVNKTAEIVNESPKHETKQHETVNEVPQCMIATQEQVEEFFLEEIKSPNFDDEFGELIYPATCPNKTHSFLSISKCGKIYGTKMCGDLMRRERVAARLSRTGRKIIFQYDARGIKIHDKSGRLCGQFLTLTKQIMQLGIKLPAKYEMKAIDAGIVGELING
jgi:hypothetical protein